MRINNGYSTHVRNPNTAIALSVLPGLGQIYNLQPRKGVIFLAVGLTNLAVILTLGLSGQIVNQLAILGENYNISPNQEIMLAFSQLHLGSPPVILLLLLFGSFILFTMRDAYLFAQSTSKPIYSKEFLELSEANSASYLFHISLMISLLVLAFFFMVPTKPQAQITSIEFIEIPQKETKEPIDSNKASEKDSKAQKHERLNRNQVPSSTGPKTAKPVTKPTRTKSDTKPITRPTNPVKPMPRMFKPNRSNPAPIAPPSVKPSPLKNPAPTPTPMASSPKSNFTAQNLLAFNPLKNLSKAPSITAPINLNSNIHSTPAPQVKNSSAASSNGINPEIKSSSKMESSNRSNKSGRQLAQIGPKNPGKNKTSNVPAPAGVKSNSKKNGTKNLISLAPDLGSSGPRPSTNQDRNQLGSSDKGKKAKVPVIDSHHSPEFGPYMANLQRTIRKHWFPPKDQQSKRVKVIFTIHTNGKMTNLKITRSSGSAIADQAALKAVRTAAPFRHLPKYSPASVDVEFTFDYNVFKAKARRW